MFKEMMMVSSQRMKAKKHSKIPMMRIMWTSVIPTMKKNDNDDIEWMSY